MNRSSLTTSSVASVFFPFDSIVTGTHTPASLSISFLASSSAVGAELPAATTNTAVNRARTQAVRLDPRMETSGGNEKAGTKIDGSTLRHPDRRRGDLVGRAVAGVRAAAAGQPADAPHRHVVVAEDLTTETHAGQAPRRQHLLFGLGHLVRFARDELDAAGGAAGVAAAGVQLIDAGLVLQRQHQPLVGRHLE